MAPVILLLAAAASSPVPTPSANPSTGQVPTLQQRFDQAVQLVDENKCGEAIKALDALLATPQVKPESLPWSMANTMKGRCQVRTAAYEQGEESIRKGLPSLKAAGAQFALDVNLSLIAMGDAALARLDYAGAKEQYLAANMDSNPVQAVFLHIKRAKAMAFDGGPEPLKEAAEAIRIAETLPNFPKDQLAALYTIQGRILLNQGRAREAYQELRKVMTLTGGLDLSVSLADIAMRGDLALAAELVGDTDNARKYQAYTGAGRIVESPFTRALVMTPPVCGAETGLRPEDFAIVDFAIGSDGHVINATTTYTTGSAQVATAFARAVSDWAWDPEQIKAIPTFYLLSTRVELRCTTAGEQAPGAQAPLRSMFIHWAFGQIAIADDGLGDQAARRRLGDKLQAMAADPANLADPQRKAAIFGLLAITDPAGPLRRDQWLTQALQAGAHIPVEPRTWLEIEQIGIRISSSTSVRGLPSAKVGDLIALLSRPEIEASPMAAGTIRLLAARQVHNRLEKQQELTMLRQVADDDRLPAQNALRQLAHLTLANVAAADKDFAAAQAHFTATGLTEEQCALLGVEPALQRSGLSNNSFPMQALMWGFEGWVRVEYDVLNDGRTANVRPLIAYPPFVFAKAAADGMKSSRFKSSYRPAGNMACSASTLNVNFRLPR